MGNQHINREKELAFVEEVLKGLIELKEKQEGTFEAAQKRYETMERLIYAFDNKIDAIDRRTEAVNARMESHIDVFESLGNYVDALKEFALSFEAKMDERFEEFAGKFDTDFRKLAEDFDKEWRKIESQLNTLEEKMIAEFQSLRAED